MWFMPLGVSLFGVMICMTDMSTQEVISVLSCVCVIGMLTLTLTVHKNKFVTYLMSGKWYYIFFAQDMWEATEIRLPTMPRSWSSLNTTITLPSAEGDYVARKAFAFGITCALLLMPHLPKGEDRT